MKLISFIFLLSLFASPAMASVTDVDTNSAEDVETNLASDCFWKNQARFFSIPPGTRGVIRIDAGWDYDVYVTACPQMDLESANRIGFRTWPRNSPNVCRGDQISLQSFGGGFRRDCHIRRIVRVR